MDLRSYRLRRGLTLDEAAGELGFAGPGRPRTLQRIETGESAADADFVARVKSWSGGEVTEADMQETRLGYLDRSGKRRAFEPARGAA